MLLSLEGVADAGVVGIPGEEGEGELPRCVGQGQSQRIQCLIEWQSVCRRLLNIGTLLIQWGMDRK